MKPSPSENCECADKTAAAGNTHRHLPHPQTSDGLRLLPPKQAGGTSGPRDGSTNAAIAKLVTVLELDHVFCMVTEPDQAARRLQDDGWVLDAGQAHRGQGTRNRRLAWPDRFFELLWVTDAAEARANPLRLDRRADWATTGASPVGLAFRGQIDPAHHDEFWLYDALGPEIWIHRDNERSPQRPLVFVLHTALDEVQRRRPRVPGAVAHRCSGGLREVRVQGPSPPSVPPYAGPPIVHVQGAHRLELVIEVHGTARPITDTLAIRW